MKTNTVIPWKWHKDTDPVFLQDWFAESLKNGVLIKKNAKRSVRKITSPSGKVYFVKQECSFRNKAKKEYAAAAMLRRAGIPCHGTFGFRHDPDGETVRGAVVDVDSGQFDFRYHVDKGLSNRAGAYCHLALVDDNADYRGDFLYPVDP